MTKIKRSNDHIEKLDGQVYLEKIPDEIYEYLYRYFSKNYQYKFPRSARKLKGNTRRLCPYYLGIHKSLAASYLQAINEVMKVAKSQPILNPSVSDGFELRNPVCVTDHEKKGDYSFAYLDAAVTSSGLKFIEFQGFPTYPFVTSRLSELVIERLGSNNLFVDPMCKHKSSDYIHKTMRTLIKRDKEDTIVIVDLEPNKLPYRVESYAAIKEIGKNVFLVDVRDIYVKDNSLFFVNPKGKETKITRFYNRLVPDDAKRLLGYPNKKKIKFRYDTQYKDMTFINHPYNFFRFSKELLPHVRHSFVPQTYALDKIASSFRNGSLNTGNYVWKRIEGYAGIGNILFPTLQDLDNLEKKEMLSKYVCQERVNYEKFFCGDGKTRMIVELRFIMVNDGKNSVFCGCSWAELNDVDRKGHFVHKGSTDPGYGLMPVIFFN